ncbi:MAG TPA: AMP-binding protein [Acidimicrobiales bacterium]|nr:AMP-binding protein [Acidimicrobiales bacterium]
MRIPQRGATVAEVFDPVLAEAPDRQALVTASGRWTYAELDRACDAAAGALTELGVRPGDRVAACLPNDVDVVTAFHAAMRIGAIWVGINQALAPPEKGFILTDSAASLLLADEPTLDELAPLRPDLAGVRHWLDVAGPPWREAVAATSGESGRAPVDPHAPAAIAYTSGTTGHPKGAVHSQHNLVVPGAAVVESRGYGPELRKGDCLPLTILNMLVLTTLLVAQAGGTCIVMDRVEAASVADWIRRERVTTWNGVPALLHTLVHEDSIPADALASLDELWVGGADCPDTLRRAVAEKFGLSLTHTYGLTEAPTIVTIDPRPSAGHDPHRPGASGVALPHLTLRLQTPPGQVSGEAGGGEICFAAVDEGPWAGVYRPPLGYWERPEASGELLAGGVVHSGDIGVIDADGYLSVRDRKNQLILRGGANVYPAEVERVLLALPEVEAAAVVGLPDERLGQRVGAVVQLVPGASTPTEELAAACARELARYKVPERWLMVGSFTRNSMGKIDRRTLADLFPVV